MPGIENQLIIRFDIRPSCTVATYNSLKLLVDVVSKIGLVN
jgi:hypothetical protein